MAQQCPHLSLRCCILRRLNEKIWKGFIFCNGGRFILLVFKRRFEKMIFMIVDVLIIEFYQRALTSFCSLYSRLCRKERVLHFNRFMSYFFYFSSQNLQEMMP